MPVVVSFMQAANQLPSVARSELILGGQRSGKSRRAEMLAFQWLQSSAEHQAVLLATGQAWDAEMQARIARHRADRALRVPGLRTQEEPLALAAALQAASREDTLVVVDCLTLWLTNLLMPMDTAPSDSVPAQEQALLKALAGARGPVVLVSNEIGLGVIPMGAQVRAFVDALGRLNQSVAGVCTRVSFMAAGLPMTLKGAD